MDSSEIGVRGIFLKISQNKAVSLKYHTHILHDRLEDIDVVGNAKAFKCAATTSCSWQYAQIKGVTPSCGSFIGSSPHFSSSLESMCTWYIGIIPGSTPQLLRVSLMMFEKRSDTKDKEER